MKDKRSAVMCLILCGFLGSTLVALADPGKSPPKTVTLKAKTGDVTFHHEQHNKDLKIPCQKCHHMMDKEKDKMACKECHKTEAEGKIVSIKDAFHNTCRGCHEKKVKEDASSKAPTKCKACHQK